MRDSLTSHKALQCHIEKTLYEYIHGDTTIFFVWACRSWRVMSLAHDQHVPAQLSKSGLGHPGRARIDLSVKFRPSCRRENRSTTPFW